MHKFAKQTRFSANGGGAMKRRLISAALAAGMAVGANASSITIDSVTQRWPWNNKVDITYTVSDGQDAANSLYEKVVFTATVNGATYTIDGSSVGASGADGTHTVTWFPPAGLRATDATMAASLVVTNVPSGNDYMIVQLVDDATTGKSKGDVWYEGLWGTGTAGQTASNTRYNADAYKTSMMVFRKIPKWADKDTLPNAESLPSGGYPTGNTANPSNNDLTYRQSKRDYYISVFMTTAAQYKNMGLDLPSGISDDAKPVGKVSWNMLRGEIKANESIEPVADAGTGTFLQRLNYMTGNNYQFDLPTFVMSELAARAGGMNASGSNTLTFWYGDTADTTKCIYTGGRAAVGSRPANLWGLYDACGNGFEWVLDDTYEQMHSLDLFVPRCKDKTKRLKRNGGGAGNGNAGGDTFKATGWEEKPVDDTNENAGFRVAAIIR